MDLARLFKMGWILQYVKRCKYIKPSVKGENYLLENLNWLLAHLETLGLSQITQVELRKLIDRLDKSYNEKEEIKDDDVYQIIESVKLWEDRINNELMNISTIEVFTEGTLNYKKMVVGGKSFFPEKVWNGLSKISKSDLNDACNCLLTKSWTPAVMISLRASEDCIRQFYKAKTGLNLAGWQEVSWKKILDDLNKIPGMDKTLIGYLDYIREMRNTAEHPDEIFDQMEAERVFHQVVNMIIVINKELGKLEEKEEIK